MEPSRYSDLSRAQRDALVRHWSRLAHRERAAVAALARCSLFLLGLGAPAELLEQTHSAMAQRLAASDHCTQLANAAAGQMLPPAALPLDGALETPDLSQLALHALDSCCIEGTRTALQSRSASAGCEQPQLGQLLEAISEAGMQQAALGWRLLRWAIAAAPGPQRQALVQRLQGAIDEAIADRAGPLPAGHPGLHALRSEGLLPPAEAELSARAALTELVQPLFALLSHEALAAAA